jgi:hypothetical protein
MTFIEFHKSIIIRFTSSQAARAIHIYKLLYHNYKHNEYTTRLRTANTNAHHTPNALRTELLNLKKCYSAQNFRP